MLDRIKKRHIILLGLLSVLAIASLIYLQNDQETDPSFIRPYDQEKDFQPLVKLMNENMFWVSERPEFSPEKVLTLRAPYNDPQRKGQASIDVVEFEDKTGGFIAYYKIGPEQGFIWLLAVDKAFRGRGFGEKLVAHVLHVFKQQGARYVTLATRTINKPALALYKKLGFVEKYRDEERGIITLIKRNL